MFSVPSRSLPFFPTAAGLKRQCDYIHLTPSTSSTFNPLRIIHIIPIVGDKLLIVFQISSFG